MKCYIVRIGLCIVWIFVLSWCPTLCTQGPLVKAKPKPEAIEGIWTEIFDELSGGSISSMLPKVRPGPDELVLGHYIWKISKGTIEMGPDNKDDFPQHRGAYKLNPENQGRAIDMLPLPEDKDRSKGLAIYYVMDDYLIICGGGSTRPKAFTNSKENPTGFTILRRGKLDKNNKIECPNKATEQAKKKPQGTQKSLEKAKPKPQALEGVWTEIGREIEGEVLSMLPELIFGGRMGTPYRWKISKDTLVMGSNEKKGKSSLTFRYTYKYKLNPENQEGAIDLLPSPEDKDQRKLLGIYFLMDDYLMICTGRGSRPKAFTSSKEIPNTIHILRRGKLNKHNIVKWAKKPKGKNK